jgi:hypothetical protein
MNWFDLLFLIFLIVFGVIGWNKGLIRSAFFVIRIALSLLIVRLFAEKAALHIFNRTALGGFFEGLITKIKDSAVSLFKLEGLAVNPDAAYLTVLALTGVIIFLVFMFVFSLIEKLVLKKSDKNGKKVKVPLRLCGLIFNMIVIVLVLVFSLNSVLYSAVVSGNNFFIRGVGNSAVSAFAADKLLGIESAKALNEKLLHDLANTEMDDIVLSSDIPLIDKLTIDRPVTIDGSAGKLIGEVNIKSSGVVLKNITIDGSTNVNIDTSGGSTVFDNCTITDGIVFSGTKAGEAELKSGTELYSKSIIKNKNFNLNMETNSKVSALVCREEGISIEGSGTIDVFESVLVPTSISDGINVKMKVEAAPMEFVIKFMPSASKQDIDTLFSEYSLTSLRQLALIDAYQVRMEGENPLSRFTALESHKLVEYIDSNYIYNSASETDSGWELSEFLWGFDNEGQVVNGQKGSKEVDISLLKAWDITRGSNEVIVAVIDTGTDINHPNLKENIWINPGETANGIDDDSNGYVDDIHGWDFLNNDNMPYDAPTADRHGTHCSGTIAAAGSSSVFGAAPDIKILPLKFLGDKPSTLSGIISAINYCKTMGIKISNNSWGGGAESAALKEAIANSGMLFICAAGNDSFNLDETPCYPSSYKLPNMISVAAVDNRGSLAGFSNYGRTTVHVGAPGVDIYSTIPGGGHDFMNGTSMAAPHVTGIAALIASSGVNDPARIKQIILNSAKNTPLNSLFATTITGGMANAATALGAAGDDKIPDDGEPVEDEILPPSLPVDGDGTPIDPSKISEGQYVEFGAYYGQPVIWQIINKAGDGLLLFSKDIIALKAFDANGDKTDGRDHIFGHRKKNGSNFWEKSNIREWLNSSQKNVTYSHLSPENSRLAWGKGGYANEPGFLTNFTSEEQSLILPVTHKSILAHTDRNISTLQGGSELLKFDKDITKAGLNYDSSYYIKVTDSVFLLSLDELKKYVYQKGMDIKGYLTPSALSHTDIIGSDHNISNPYLYWLRTPLAGAGNSTYYVDASGSLDYAPAYGGNMGLRPALYVSYDTLRYGSGSLEDPYRYTSERKEAVDVSAALEPSADPPAPSGLAAASSNVPTGWGNTSVNMLNGGYIGMDNGFAYFNSASGIILKIKEDGSQKQEYSTKGNSAAINMNVVNGNIFYPGEASVEIIRSDGSTSSIGDLCHSSKSGDPKFLMVQGEWMYYSITASDGRTRIYKIKTDGSSRTKLEQFDHTPGNMAYGSDGIYYLASPKGGNSSAIYRVRYDAAGLSQEYGSSSFANSDKIVEIESSKGFAIFNDNIYYVTESDAVYGIRTDGSGKKKITDAKLQTFGLFGPFYTLMCEADEWLYVNIQGKGTCRVKTDGSGKTEIVSSASCATVFNSELYFTTQSGIYKTDMDGNNKIVIE